jgi:hypothetical protein
VGHDRAKDYLLTPLNPAKFAINGGSTRVDA